MSFAQFLNRCRSRLQSNRRAPHPRRAARRLGVEALEGRLLMSVSALVFPGPSGKLVYTPDAQGNIIPDFSNVGFEGGNQPLPGEGGVPDVPVRATVTPKPGARDADIQAAIDAVSALPPDARGYRGVVLLKAGRYDLVDHVTIHQSGVILRGEGTGANGTVLVAKGTARRYDQNDPTQDGVVRFEGDIPATVNLTGSARLPLAPGASIVGITDVYVPVGAHSFHVTTTTGLAVGQSVMVHRPSTEAWLESIHMDKVLDANGNVVLDQNGQPVRWKVGEIDLDADRVITAVDRVHNLVTLDAPLTNALEQPFGEALTAGGPVFAGSLFPYAFPGRIDHVGLENLRGESDFDPSIKADGVHFTDENHAWTFVSMVGVANGWANHVEAHSFAFSAIEVQKTCKWITVANCSSIDPVSEIRGGRRDIFRVAGQLTLVKNAYSLHGRHDFILGSVTPGPNVFVNCTAEESFSESGPHARYATGALFDNVIITAATGVGADSQAGALNAYNRGLESGSLQGWAGANIVFWNSHAAKMLVEQVPGAQNYAIGNEAPVETVIPPRLPQEPLGYFESVGQHVAPASLYFAQVHDRLTPVATPMNVTAAVQLTGKALGTTLTLTVRNISTTVLHGPLRLVFTILPTGVVLENTEGRPSQGQPSFIVYLKEDTLLPGQDFTVVIHSRTILPLSGSYALQVLAPQVVRPILPRPLALASLNPLAGIVNYAPEVVDAVLSLYKRR